MSNAKSTPNIPKGVWSAAPTPFTPNMELDIPSIERMTEHHIRLGVKGVFLAGTCGEGPYMRNDDISRLVKETVRASAGRLRISVQVSDNSSVRILDNIKRVADAGADVAVIAPPYFRLNNTEENLLTMYRETIRESELPIGIYDRGSKGAVVVPESVLEQVYLEDNVVMVKDSSAEEAHRALALRARDKRPGLSLFNGDEFDCVSYMEAGYDGLLLGGGVFNGFMANTIIDKVAQGDREGAVQVETAMIDIMYRVFGGKNITCWLSGQKRLLVELGVFSTWDSYYRFPLTAECEKNIVAVAKEHRKWLLP